MNCPPLPRAHSRRGAAQERLLHGTTEAADRHGFARLTVERILAVAEVSRATFYQYFSNVEDCFWSAYRHHAEQLTGEVAAAVAAGADRELAALDAIAAFAVSRPAAARLLMREGLAAGGAGLTQRDELIAGIVRATGGEVPRPSTVDLPPAVLIGGMLRFLAMRLSDAGTLETAGDQLREWACAFTAGASRPRWSSRLTPALPEPSSHVGLSGSRPHGSVRERIVLATALSISTRGYHAMTVADIVAAAGVSRRRFYNEFPGKAAAFIAAYEFAFQRVLATTTPAFFAQSLWRERVWHAALAFTGFLAREPVLAYLGFVECHALGPDFTLRVHDTQLAFTLFLEDGYRQRSEAESLPRAFSALAAATIFELAFQASRRAPRFHLRSFQPLAVYIALSPFIGLDAAGGFVIEKISRGRSDASATA